MTENPTDRPEAVEPQGDLHAAFVAALQGQPAHQDGAGIVRRVAPWAAHRLADRCVELVREHDAPEHHPDLIALNAQDGGEREALEQLAAALADSDAFGCGCCAAYDYDAVSDAENPRAMALAMDVLPTLAASPAPVVSGEAVERVRAAIADTEVMAHPTLGVPVFLSYEQAELVARAAIAALGLTVADEGREGA